MNINPLYLQEVSREYYTKILNNSRQQKAAANLTKKWLAKNPNATRKDVLDKYSDFSMKVHKKYDKARKRQYDDTYGRNGFISTLITINKDDPENKFKSKYGVTKDDLFKTFRLNRRDIRKLRLKQLEKSRKNKIMDDLFNF